MEKKETLLMSLAVKRTSATEILKVTKSEMIKVIIVIMVHSS